MKECRQRGDGRLPVQRIRERERESGILGARRGGGVGERVKAEGVRR